MHHTPDDRLCLDLVSARHDDVCATFGELQRGVLPSRSVSERIRTISYSTMMCLASVDIDHETVSNSRERAPDTSAASGDDGHLAREIVEGEEHTHFERGPYQGLLP